MSKVCNGCKPPDDMASVPFVVFEAERERHRREKKRLIMLIAVLTAALLAINAVWLVQARNENKQLERETDTCKTTLKSFTATLTSVTILLLFQYQMCISEQPNTLKRNGIILSVA